MRSAHAHVYTLNTAPCAEPFYSSFLPGEYSSILLCMGGLNSRQHTKQIRRTTTDMTTHNLASFDLHTHTYIQIRMAHIRVHEKFNMRSFFCFNHKCQGYL